MALRLDCGHCGAELRITPRHRGRMVTCRQCDRPVDVPGELDFRSNTRAALEDRRLASRYVMAAYLSVVTCLPAAPLVIWWLVSRRMGFARDQDRPVIAPYLHARVVCIVAVVAQAALWVRIKM